MKLKKLFDNCGIELAGLAFILLPTGSILVAWANASDNHNDKITHFCNEMTSDSGSSPTLEQRMPNIP
jgi:hypothetical protein